MTKTCFSVKIFLEISKGKFSLLKKYTCYVLARFQCRYFNIVKVSATVLLLRLKYLQDLKVEMVLFQMSSKIILLAAHCNTELVCKICYVIFKLNTINYYLFRHSI